MLVMQQEGIDVVGFLESLSEERCAGCSVAVVCQSCTLRRWRDCWSIGAGRQHY